MRSAEGTWKLHKPDLFGSFLTTSVYLYHRIVDGGRRLLNTLVALKYIARHGSSY